MKKHKTFFVNEAKESLELYETDDIARLMQQEHIEIKLSGEMLKPAQIKPVKGFNKVWYAGPNTDTIVMWSSKTNDLAIMSNELAQIIFKWQGRKIESPREIKPVVETAMQTPAKWKAFEIVTV